MKKFLNSVFLAALLVSSNELFALVLPPGFIIRQFAKTRENVDTFKIEQKITYKNEFEFKETLWVKYPNKIRAYIQKDDEAILFIREGKECLAVTSSRKIISDNLCRDVSGLMSYRLLFPGYNYEGYLKHIGIELWEKDDQFTDLEHGYVKPEGIQLVRDKGNPVLIVGLDDSTYQSKLRSARSSSNVGDDLIDKLKYEDPQIWLDNSTLYPTRIYGSGGLEIYLKNYTTDANDIPMPSTVEVLKDGKMDVAFGLTSVETKLNIDDSFLSIEAYNSKFKGTVQGSSLPESKSVILDYVKNYR